ncbi:hypothetical protein [Helicobacter sp. 23-1045]
MRYIVIIFAFFALLNANPMGKCGSVYDFNANQKEIIAYAYNYGKKYGLGYTLAAIAWHESCAGEYRMNFADPSAGLYHALIPNVIRRYQMLKDNGFNRNVIGEMLIRDDEFASKVAIDELLYWDKVRNGNWKDMIKSYNKGFSWEKSASANKFAENYYQNVKKKREILEDYIPKYLSNIKLKERKPLLSDYTVINKDSANSTQVAEIIKKQKIAEKIRRIEVGRLANDNPDTIKKAREAKKAVISVYKPNENGEMIHEKTITLKPTMKAK